MTEARQLLRLRAGLSDELRCGLESSAIEPSAEELAFLTSKVSAALALPLVVPAALAASGTSKVLGLASVQTTLPLWKLGVWVLGGVALGVGLSGAVAATAVFSASGSPTPAVTAVRRAVAASVPAGASQPSSEPSVVPSAALSASPARRAPSAVAPVDEPRPPPEDELSLLHRAQASLSADPARALQLTLQHELEYPTGALAQERDVIEVEALLRLGRRPEAEAHARRFAVSYPGSAHAVRIEQLLRDARRR